jgi:hypothetical protein
MIPQSSNSTALRLRKNAALLLSKREFVLCQASTGIADPRRMKLWVPHPRRVFVFAARVGKDAFCKFSLFC